jgi:hypothetical protein
LEAALRTVKAQLALASKQDEDEKVHEYQLRAEDAESRVDGLLAQVESEMKRTERMRVSWQNEMIKVSEKAGAAEEDARQWRIVADNAQRDADKYQTRVRVLEKALRDSEEELQILVQQGSATDDKNSYQQAFIEAQQRIEILESGHAEEVKRLRGTIESLREQINSQEKLLESERREKDALVSATVTAVANANISSAVTNFAGVEDELRQQRNIMQRQTALLEALLMDLSNQGAGVGSLSSKRLVLPAAGETLQDFSFNARGSVSNSRVERAGEISTSTDGRVIQTQQIEVDGDPYLIDEDNNLYSPDDHRFVRKLHSSTKLRSDSSGKADQSSSSDSFAVNDIEQQNQDSKRKRSERIRSIRKRVGQSVGRVVESASSRLASVSRSVFSFLVGDSDIDSDRDENDDSGGDRVARNVVETVAIELPGQREFDGQKMRPAFLEWSSTKENR